MRRLLPIILLAVAVASASTAAADAEGGPSITTAPAVAPGQQEFGNMKTPLEPQSSCAKYLSWWSLLVIGGDTVQIDWEAQASNADIAVFPAGTTDFNFPQMQALSSGYVNSNHKSELTFQATQAASVPLQFSAVPSCGTGVGGPYSFTAYITHGLSVGLPHLSSLRAKGTLTVPVHSPEGGPINDPVQVEVQIKGRGAWQRLGVGTASNSAAVIPFKLSAQLRHQRVTLRALARGTGYTSASSSHVKVRTL